MTACPRRNSVSASPALPVPGRPRLAGVVEQSIVDGPGMRLAVFTQGCPHGCPGCQNPRTHDFNGGYDGDADSLLALMDENPLLAGVTLSGGEPMIQAAALRPLAEAVRARGKTVWCYTGFTFEQLRELSFGDDGIESLLPAIDVLVDGRFERQYRDESLLFRGSANQRILDVRRSLAAGSAIEVEGYGASRVREGVA